MNNLVPSSRWLFRINVYLGFLPLLFILFVFSLILIIPSKSVSLLLYLFFVAFVIIIAEIYARLSYKNYLYEINNNEIKIEKGIIWKKYTSIPYEKVQNINVSRGIIARIFGFSTIDIETAGSSMGYGNGYRFRINGLGYNNRRYQSEGHLPAVSIEEAEKLRDFIMKKINKNKK